jgi:thiol-disulfide isomerase/thioredoxin
MSTKGIGITVAVAIAAIAGGLGARHWLQQDEPQPDTANTSLTAPSPPTDPVQALWASTLLHDPDGKPATLAAFKGHIVVVNFWASWCGPCVEEMPALMTLNNEYAKKGVKFVGIGVDSEKNVKAFLQKVPVDYPVYVSGFGGADLARNFGNTAGGLPFTVVIEATGAVRSTKLGQIEPTELKKTLDTL